MEMMTMEQFNRLKSATEDAQNDDTPILVVDGDELHVKGDPNKTEIKPKDYEVTFAFPDTKEFRDRIAMNNDKIIREIDGYIVVNRKYKGIYITPRNIGKAVTAFTLVEQFFNRITDNGEVKSLTNEEIKVLFDYINHEIGDATYEVCASVLRIPYDEIEWVLPLSAVENAIKIVANNPSVVNEADLFFGLSPEEA